MVDAGAVPRGPLLPPQRRDDRDAAAARAQGRHRARSPNFFIRRFSGELKKKIDGLEPDALKLLMRYHWPGNIRELENAIERAMLLADGTHIAVDDLRLGDTGTLGSPRDGASVVKIPPTGIPLEEIERLALIEALKMSNWVQKDAAELLAISPRVMNYKIKTLGIDFPRGRRVGREDPADRHSPRRGRAHRPGRGAQDVELGAEGRGRTARHQPARHELQDQDARHRLPARPPSGAAAPRAERALGLNVGAAFRRPPPLPFRLRARRLVVCGATGGRGGSRCRAS